VDVHELTAAYALDALDAGDRERYEEHLGRCADCREQLAQLSETAGALAYGVDTPAPAPELRARILSAAAADNVIHLPARRVWALRGVATAAACVAAGFAIWAVSLSHSLDRERSARATAAQAMQVLADPGAHRVALRGASGVVAVDRTGMGVLVIRSLAPAPAGKTYEAWVVRGGKAVEAGLFAGSGGVTVVPLSESVPIGAVVAATVERRGGAKQPTSKPFLSATA
jgi:anti-sigma-K factor RskA